MKVRNTNFLVLLFSILLFSCTEKKEKVFKKGTLGYDIEFLKKYHKDLITLTSNEGEAIVVVAPAYQGRVMTSGSKGRKGPSFGWINYDLIEAEKFREHINVFGGEDRFWIGPEGGQYSVFFEKGAEFIFENWFTPAPIDTEPYLVENQDQNSVLFTKEFSLSNYAGSKFSIGLKREISILETGDITSNLGVNFDELEIVGFQSKNTLTNKGENAWSRDTGMPSIWILGMFKPDEKTVVFAPYKNPNDSLPLLTDEYFGKIPETRIKITDQFVLFKGDGKSRGKFGLRQGVATKYIGSYSPEENLLTLVKYSLSDEKSDFVNSLWKIQSRPFEGDVVNSYNDGPLENGEQLGPFYELESSSPAAALSPGESLEHIHTTLHFKGKKESLNQIIKTLFNADINTLTF